MAALLIQHHNQEKTIPVQTYYRLGGFQEAEAPSLRDNRYMKGIRLSALRTGRLYPPGNIPQHPNNSNNNNNNNIVIEISYGCRREIWKQKLNLTFRWTCMVKNSYNKTNYMHWFLKFIFGIKLYMFRTVPLSIIRSFSLYTQQCYISYSLRASCQQTCMICTIAVCTVQKSWWWTEELSETCRVLFHK